MHRGRIGVQRRKDQDLTKGGSDVPSISGAGNEDFASRIM